MFIHVTSPALARRISVLATAVLLLAACAEDEGDRQMPAPPVITERFEPATVTVRETYAGRTRGAREVQVRARVEGILEERLYIEGQIVEGDAPLFRIDPRPFEIALDQARAQQADAEARLTQARLDWQRISRLHEQNVISTAERDNAKAALDLAEAGLAQASAAVASARLNLSWTEVAAPVAGVTSLETLSEGNLVERGTLLTTITQTDPIHVRFAVPERDARVHRIARRAMAGSGDEHRRPATLILPNDETYPLEGVVNFTDASIDPATGSVSARAVFPNPDSQIIPGEFVRVGLVLETLEEVFVLPPSAIGEDREGPRVFVVDEQDTARARRVTLGPQIPEGQVVQSGIEAGERVIVRGLVNLEDGMAVRPDADSPAQPGAGEE